MNEKNEMTLRLDQVIAVIWKRKWILLLAGVLAAALTFAGTELFVTSQYQADVMIYVNNSSISIGSTSVSIASGEITAARQLLNTYLVILKSRSTLGRVIDQANLPYSRAQLAKMISAGAINNTEVFRVTVTATDPEEARVIADTIAEVLPDILQKVIKGSSVEVIDYAAKPQGRVSSGATRNAGIAFGAIVILLAVYFVLRELLDDEIHNEDTLTELFEGIPVLANIPHTVGGKGSGKGYGKGYGYGYGGGYERSGGQNGSGGKA